MLSAWTPKRRAPLALALLLLRALSLLALAVFVLLEGGNPLVTGLQLADFLLSAAVLGLWWLLLRGLLTGQAARTTSPALLAFRYGYPVVIAYEGMLWALNALGLLGLNLNPLALLLLLGVTLAALLVNLLAYTESARLFPNPADSSGWARLAGLLNVASALSLASSVMNLVPPAGVPPLTHAELIAFGLAGAVELASLVSLGWALGLGDGAPEERPGRRAPQ